MVQAFKAAFRGLRAAWFEERHLKIHTLAIGGVSLAAMYLGVSRTEWALLVLCFGLVTGLEYANSALERLANRVTTERDPWIRDAKDMAAAAVLVASMAAAAVGLLVLGPPLVEQLGIRL